jgi:hypothetical protein
LRLDPRTSVLYNDCMPSPLHYPPETLTVCTSRRDSVLPHLMSLPLQSSLRTRPMPANALPYKRPVTAYCSLLTTHSLLSTAIPASRANAGVNRQPEVPFDPHLNSQILTALLFLHLRRIFSLNPAPLLVAGHMDLRKPSSHRAYAYAEAAANGKIHPSCRYSLPKKCLIP